MKYAAVFAIGAALAAAAAVAWPQNAPPSRDFSSEYAELGLTAEQRSRIDALVRQFEARMGPICGAIGQHRRELYAELRKDSPDAARVDAAIEGMVSSRREMQRALVDHLTAAKPVLTPEQRARLFDRLSAERR